MKQIDIPFTPPGSKANQTIPVCYALENREEACIQIIHCKVALPPAQLPAWLQPGAFELVTHVRDGMQLVDYNATAGRGLSTQDSDAFRYKVYSEIFFRERAKNEQSFSAC